MKRKRAYGNQKLQKDPALVDEPGTSISCKPLHKSVSNERAEENNPNALGQMIATIIKEISKEAGGLANLSRSLVDNPISNGQVAQPHADMDLEENESRLHQNPEYKQQELNAALTVIKKTMKLDAADPFNRPVDPVALGIPDYFDVIKTPMDFGTICNNLENGVKYMNSADVFKDVEYIWNNCVTYNKKGDHIVELMKRVKTFFTRYWKAAGLHIQQSPSVAAFRMDSTNTASFKHTDLARKYGTQNPKNKNYFTCNFCQKLIKGGALRLKQHLVGGNKNVTDCPNCPESVREEVKSSMLKKQIGKEECKKITIMQQLGENANDEEQKCVDLSQKKPKQKDSIIIQKKPQGWGPTRCITLPDGQPVNEATAVVTVTSEVLESPIRKEEKTINKNEYQDDVYNRIIGPSKKRDEISTIFDTLSLVKKKNAEVVEVKEKLKSVEKTCSQMAAQMSAMVSMMANMQKVVGTSVPVSIQNQPEAVSTSNHEVPAKQTRGRKKRK